MKKKLLNVLSIGIIALSLSSCSLLHEDIKPTDNIETKNPSDNNGTKNPTENENLIKPWLSGKTAKRHNFTYDISLDDCDELKQEMKKAKEYVSEESHFDYFNEVYTKLETFYYEAHDAEDIEFLEYALYGNTSNLDISEEFSNIQTDILQWYNEVEHIAYANSFKEKLWEGKTDEEILEIIGENYPEEFFELKKKLTSLENDFNVLTDTKKADGIYTEYVNTANKLSKYLDFDNYLDYSYQYVYHRDYNAKDTDDFFKYVVQYLVPYASELDELADTSSLSGAEIRKINDYFNGNAFTEKKFSYIENYKNNVGGIVKDAFDNLFKEDGCYFISYDSEGYDGAYQYSIQDTPYVFYGPRYHSYSTIIHEFGHYVDAYNGGTIHSYDLLETHSQGNEVMFLNYYLNNFVASDNYKKFVRNYKIYEFVQSVIICSIINEVEKRCYTSAEFNSGDLKKELRSIYNEYSGLEKIYPFNDMLDYAYNVVVTSACYYISYATSILGSLYLEKLAYRDFDKAKETYLKLFTYENCDSYRDVYEYAGIEDPFNEEMFKYIVK